MLFCDICYQKVEEGDYQHFVDNHPELFESILEEHLYEWDGYDAREEALTVGERNPTLK